MSVLKILSTASALIAIVASAVGHHSPAGLFDPKSTPVAISGKITAVELRNPHSFFWMDAMDSNGVVHNWKAEYGGVWRLEIPGVDRSIGLSGADEKRIPGALKPGAAVSVEGIRAKDGSYWISFKFLSDDQGKTLVDMRTVPVGQGAPTSH